MPLNSKSYIYVHNANIQSENVNIVFNDTHMFSLIFIDQNGLIDLYITGSKIAIKTISKNSNKDLTYDGSNCTITAQLMPWGRIVVLAYDKISFNIK